MRIELVGGMGCGKTTLAEELAKRGAVHVPEFLDDNPFLEACYEDFDTYSFPSQMWFALTKYREIGVYNRDDQVYVHDQAVINNNAYTNMLLAGETYERERKLVNDFFELTVEYLGEPDLVIWLHCPPHILEQRVMGRGREHEKAIDKDFLQDLDNCIRELMADAARKGYNIIELDSSAVNFTQDTGTVDDLWKDIFYQHTELQNDLQKELQLVLTSQTNH